MRNQKWLKVVHVYLGGIWGGGAASLFAIHCLYPTNSGAELYIRNIAMAYIDNYIIIPAAVGTSFTGLLYSHFTRWGYLKYYWIIVKWFFTLFFMIFGFIWLIPWLDKMLAISNSIRHLHMIDSSIYDVDMSLHLAMSVAQTVLVLIIAVISIFKPWGRTRFKW